MCKKNILCIIGIILSLIGKAQIIDNTSDFTLPQMKQYIKFYYDNDFFTATDYYYSQGITLEMVHPKLSKAFWNKLLYTKKNKANHYGINVNIFGHTPTSISSDSILRGDRPFAANATIQVFAIVVDSTKKIQFTTKLAIGVLGPTAKGYEIQNGIHKWINDELPKGWQYQIQNTPIITYTAALQKRVVESAYFTLHTSAEAKVGIHQNKLAIGTAVVVGNYLPNIRQKNMYLFINSKVWAVGYDASLQGGLFKKNNAYTIDNAAITRFVLQADAGVVLQLKKIQLSYTQSFLTKEFNTGTYHRWGGFRIAFKI